MNRGQHTTAGKHKPSGNRDDAADAQAGSSSQRTLARSSRLSKSVPVNRYLLFFGIAVVGCWADLWTKTWWFARLGMPGESPTWWLVPEMFGFRTSLNEGALFGLGQGLVFVFAGLSVVAAAFILYWLFYLGAARDLLLTVALAAVMAGIFGNLYDRLGLHDLTWHFPPERFGEPVYAVRDWIQFSVGEFEWPTFNIADSLLVCGAALLVWHAFRAEPAAESQPDQNAAEKRAAS